MGEPQLFLTHKAIEFRFQESLPDIPVYKHIDHLKPSEVIQYDQVYKLVERPLEEDFWYQRGIDSTSTISDWQHSMRKVIEERKRIRIYGFIAYEDLLDIRIGSVFADNSY